MKSTGIVRRLDELGRITLPIELRRNFDVNERDPLEIFVDDDKIILKKYNPADIFTGEDNDKGKLENILLPLMKKDTESIFESSKKFLEENHEVERCKSKFDDLKSIIGTAGQLQISGTSNTVCIEKSDYLTNEKILDNEKCKEIIAFFEKLIN